MGENGRRIIITPRPPLTPAQKVERQRKERERALRAQQRQREMEKQGQSKTLYPRMVGEFEKQQAVLFSICDWQPQHYGILRDVVENTAGHAKLIVLYDDKKQLASALKVLAKRGKVHSHVQFLELDLDTVWLRDFGPRLAEKEDGSPMSIDFYYDGTRPKDDLFPEDWAKLTGAELNHVPWTLQGGNLMSNGEGLAVATSRIFEDNRVKFPTAPGKDPIVEQENFVARQFKLFCNIKDLVLLKPLENESTRHIDMFATILAPDLILMAQVDRRYDPQNAQILDQNARRMSQVKVNGKPMRVERITVPPRNGKYWSPYTNIVLTDRLVLMPTFKTDPPAYVRRAVEVYKRLLPNHHIATIDMTTMNKLEGSLHCLSCNVPDFATLPKGLVGYQDALRLNAELVKNAPTWVVPESNTSVVSTSPRSSTVPDTKPTANPEKSLTNNSVLDPPVVARKPAAPKPSKPIVKNEPSKPSAETQPKDSRSSDLQRRIAAARKAVKTYRRVFHSSSREHKIDAYVVEVKERSITLLNAETKRELEVRLSYIHESDREWVVEHQKQINDNGERVKDFLLNFD